LMCCTGMGCLSEATSAFCKFYAIWEIVFSIADLG
jgi:hypothetical protein